MNKEELFNLLQELSSSKKNLIKEIESSNLRTAQLNDGKSLILEAIFNDFVDLAKIIRGKTEKISLAEACSLGDLDTITKLVDQDKTIVNSWTSDGFTPLTLACTFSGSVEIIEYLLKNGAGINIRTKSPFIKVAPIHASMFGGRNDILEILLKNGANPNLPQENNTSYPLHEAILKKDRKALEILLQYGADKNNVTKDGKTALDYAKEIGFLKGQELLR